jgi:hypothetical protein
MQTQRALDREHTSRSPESILVAAPKRSVRRATARRASTRRATARRRTDNVERRIIEYMKGHPHSTTGDIAKALNSDRATIAAGVSHMVRASRIASPASAMLAEMRGRMSARPER